MAKSCRKSRNNFWFCITEHFSLCRTFLIIFCGTFLIGVLVGCFSFAKFNKVFGFSNLNILNADVFFSSVSIFSFAFKKFLKLFLVLIIIYLFSLNVFLVEFNVILTSYVGYLLGANMVMLTIFFGIFGTFATILIYLPIEICVCFLIINFACFCEKTTFDNYKYGKFCLTKSVLFPSAVSFAFLICAIIFILLLLEGLILPKSIKNILIKL